MANYQATSGPERVAQAEANVRNTARALKAVYRTPTARLCEQLHISRATWFHKLRGNSSFTVPEIVEMSTLWGVRITDFFEGRVVLPEQPIGPDGGADIACYRRQSRPLPIARFGSGLASQAAVGHLRLASAYGRILSVSTANDLRGDVA